MQPYHSPYELLLDQIERAFLLTERAVRQPWTAPGGPRQAPASLLRLLGADRVGDPTEEQQRVARIEGELGDLQDVTTARLQAARLAGPSLPAIVRHLGLDALQTDLLLLLLAYELDARFFALYAHLQGERRRHGVDAAVLAEIVCPTPWLRARLLEEISPRGTLVAHRLVEVMPTDSQSPPPLVLTPLRVHPAVLDFVMGAPPAPVPYRVIVTPTLGPSDLVLGEGAAAALESLRGRLAAWDSAPALLLHGPEGTGKRSFVGALCRDLGLGLFELDLGRASPEPETFDEEVRRWLVEGTLYRAVCLASPLDALIAPEGAPADPRLRILAQHVDASAGPVALSSRTPYPLHRWFRRPTSSVSLGRPTAAMQESLWRAELGRAGAWLPTEQVQELTVRYNVSGGTIRGAIDQAVRWRGPLAASGAVFDVVEQSLRRHVGTRLSEVATRVQALATREDLITSPELMDRVDALLARVHHRHQVLGAQGMGRRLRLGAGVTALFWGPPGTGKSMVAGVIARELGFELYQVNLSGILSKWLGETEKNLARLFDEAETGHVITLFDEADSLFATRTSDDSPQGQASVQRINFILTRLETFRGFAILTSNREQAVDPAFKRRLNASVYFPIPDLTVRERIWTHMLAGLGDDLPVELLARCELSGGYIRNAVATAAFLAARRGQRVSPPIVLAALRQTLDDLGHVVPMWLIEAAAADA